MNDGGPAFPTHVAQPYKNGTWCHELEGLSVRDYFAAAALPTAPMIDAESISKTGTELAVKAIASWAYRVADAMLELRATKTNSK
jgi:hypothetical protein